MCKVKFKKGISKPGVPELKKRYLCDFNMIVAAFPSHTECSINLHPLTAELKTVQVKIESVPQRRRRDLVYSLGGPLGTPLLYLELHIWARLSIYIDSL